ncbi:tripartite motif-containing protein 16-like isoform X2 [Hemibagrus wyckioides]|uniref:tripartite motif-containing protein 16-like isoform X2 n=1 Tax=Hemibagrus wyckioides TaxID=337641 RepID=UPI00266BC01F|nr:tripartite motif-containing protein 16-like isoform X2 [Hemibagrus wyckioides]
MFYKSRNKRLLRRDFGYSTHLCLQVCVFFTEMISSMEKKRSEVIELIRAQEKAELNQAERLLKQLELENTDLKRRVTELEQLFKGFRSLCVSSDHEDSPSITVHHHLSFDGVRNSLSDLKKRFKEFCKEEFNKIPPHVSTAAAVQKISLSEPKGREDFLEYFCYLTLDPNTAHNLLRLSEKNRVVRWSMGKPYSDHPERFDSCYQVLCKENVCGCCYWEVKWSGVVYISVSYKEIRRKGEGKECGFGHNSQSWSLFLPSSSLPLFLSFSLSFFLSFYHNIESELRVPSSSRIEVYVNHSAGSLSFYSVSDTMGLINRVHTTFTQPLYAGFGFYAGTVWLCDPQ